MSGQNYSEELKQLDSAPLLVREGVFQMAL